MYCKHCGKEIDEDSKFCRYCGQKLTDNYNNDTESTSLVSLFMSIVSFFKNPNAKQLLSTTFLGAAAIIGILAYLITLTISSEILHTFGLSRIEQLNTDISMCLGIVVVIISEIMLAISFVNDK